jgi:hypothetical protein
MKEISTVRGAESRTGRILTWNLWRLLKSRLGLASLNKISGGWLLNELTFAGWFNRGMLQQLTTYRFIS